MENLPLDFGLLCGGFFFVITFAIAIYLLVQSSRSKKKAGESQNWPAAPGTITVSEVRESRTTDQDDNIQVSYYPYVEYTYFAGGQVQTSKMISFGGTQGFNRPQPAQEVLQKYPLNGSVMVYYNPQKPQEAVLEKVAGSGAKTARTIGIIVLIISLLILIPLLIGLIRN